MLYHLYQRTISKNGKKIKVWYYWYYDKNGKQIRKSCGQHGKPCTIKREAQAYIETLPDEVTISNQITFNDFCKSFYDDNSVFMIKQKNRGIELKNSTLYSRRHYLQIFLDKFGEMKVDSVTGVDFDNWLLSLDLCASVRNQILIIIEEVEKELYANHLIKSLPYVERYKRKNKNQKGILTTDEIKRLFPDDYESLIQIWKLKFNGETETDAYMFAAMIYTTLSTGMRSGEVRALQWNQFIDKNAILVNAQVDSDDKRINLLKKGSQENKKWRVVVIPDKTVRMLNNLRQIYPYQTDYVFERHGEKFTTWYLLDHFKNVMNKNGIDHIGRNITIHSLRFTYNTLMRPELSGEDLRLMIGHSSAVMTDYYDRSEAVQHLPGLLLNKDKIDSIWN